MNSRYLRHRTNASYSTVQYLHHDVSGALARCCTSFSSMILRAELIRRGTGCNGGTRMHVWTDDDAAGGHILAGSADAPQRGWAAARPAAAGRR